MSKFVPSYSSVAPVIGGVPPKANAAVCVPQPAKEVLAVFKLLPVAQEPAAVAPVYFKSFEVLLYQV
jgi:hypothetical protein